MAKFLSRTWSSKNRKWKKHKSFRQNQTNRLSTSKSTNKSVSFLSKMPQVMLGYMICGEMIRSQDLCPVMHLPLPKVKEKNGWLLTVFLQPRLSIQTRVNISVNFRLCRSVVNRLASCTYFQSCISFSISSQQGFLISCKSIKKSWNSHACDQKLWVSIGSFWRFTKCL